MFLTNLPYLVAYGRFQHHCGCQHPHDDLHRPDDEVRCGDDDDDFVGCGYVLNGGDVVDAANVDVAPVVVGDDLDNYHCDPTLWPNNSRHFQYHLQPLN